MSALTLEELAAQVQRLQERVHELEQRPGTGWCYRGVWQEDRLYQRFDVTTDRGSLWFCWAPTLLRPGSTLDWQCVARRGANGRDFNDARYSRAAPGPT
jgi:hypothetical protein